MVSKEAPGKCGEFCEGRAGIRKTFVLEIYERGSGKVVAVVRRGGNQKLGRVGLRPKIRGASVVLPREREGSMGWGRRESGAPFSSTADLKHWCPFNT